MEKSILAELPIEIQSFILNFLSFEDLLASSLTCKHIAELAKELIEKKGILRIPHTFLDLECLSKLVRSYKRFVFEDEHFLYEREKIENIFKILTDTKIKFKEIRVKVKDCMGVVYGSEMLTPFLEYLEVNPGIQQVSFYAASYCNLEDLFVIIKSILPHVNIYFFEASEGRENKNVDLIVPEVLQELYSSNKNTEIDLLNTLKKYPNLRKLKYSFESGIINEVIDKKAELNLYEVPLKSLTLLNIISLEVNSPGLNVFKHLRFLNLDFGWNHNGNSFEFAKSLFKQNQQTLKAVEIRVPNSKYIHELLPPTNINLNLEDITLNFNSLKNKKLNQKFAKQFINLQLPTLRKLCLGELDIDGEMMEFLSRAKHLQRLTLQKCKIKEIAQPSFNNLRVLNINHYSEISYSYLVQILENRHLQENLESLTLDSIQLEGDQEQLTSHLIFPRLKKIKIVIFNFKTNLLNKISAPELEKLVFYDGPDIDQLLLDYVLEYPKLKVLRMEKYTSAEGISGVLSKLKNIELLRIEIPSSLLVGVLEHLLIPGCRIKLAFIICNELEDLMLTNESFIEFLSKLEPDIKVDFDQEDLFLRLSNIIMTIFITVDNYREHGEFYEEFLSSMWE